MSGMGTEMCQVSTATSLLRAWDDPRAAPSGDGDLWGQPHPQCVAQGCPTRATPGPDAIGEAPVAGMILARTSWLLPQRCLGGISVLCTVGPEGLGDPCVTVVMLIGARQKRSRQRRAPDTGASHHLWQNLATVWAAGPHCTRMGVAPQAG